MSDQKIVLDPTTYWKLKARFLEVIIQERQLAEKKRVILAEANLEPDKNYSMDDETLSVDPL